MASEIDNLFRQIDHNVFEGHHDTVAELATRILHLVPTDLEAVQVKTVALLQSGEYENALRLIESVPRLSTKMAPYKAYCLYRTSRYAEAQKILNNNAAMASTLPMKHLLAQIYVKLSQFENARKVRLAIDSRL